MNDFGQALQTASPFLLGLGAQLQGRDPNGISSGLAQMQEEAEKARRKSAIADLMGQMGIGGSKAALLDMLPFEAQAQMLMQEQQRMEGDAAFNDLYGALYGGGGGYGDISAPNMGGVASGPLNPTPSDANYVAPEDLQPVFSAAEQQYNLPSGYLARTAKIESGFNPNAKNPNSSATGLFQFIGSTAKQYGLANPTDPMASTEAAARLAADNAAVLRRTLGREPTSAELYLAHQQGAGGAARLLSNPDARAADIVGADAVRLNGGSLDMTAGQFANKWLRKFGQPKQQDDNVTRRALARAMMSDNPQLAQFAQMEYEKRFGAQEPVKGVAVGGRLVNPYSGEVIFDGGGEQDMPAQVRELQWRAQQAGLEPGTEPYRQFMLAGGAQKGMSLTVGPNGEIRFTQGGVQSGETTVGQAYNPGEARSTVDLIDEILTDPNLSRVTGPIEGGGGNDVEEFGMARRTYYGSGGIALIEKVNQLQSRAWLAARDMLKGGGPITDYESRKAEAAVARLNRAKDDADYKKALTDLRDAITEGMAKLEAAQGGGQAGDGWAEIDGVRIREKR